MKISIFLIILFMSTSAFAFGTIGKIRKAETLYNKGLYEQALGEFLSAQVEMPDNLKLKYNIANTYYKLGKTKEAERIYADIAEQSESLFKERNLYNKGNALYKNNKLEESIKAYESALKVDPKDEDAKFNLEFVKKKMEQQKQDNKQNKDDKQDKEKEQDKKQKQKQKENEQNQDKENQKDENDSEQDKSKEEKQNKKQDEQQKEQEQKENQQSQGDETEPKNQQEREGSMSKEEANRWLSTVKEGQQKKYPKSMKSKGKYRGKGEW